MLDIFEILGPIMVGPSSSHSAGAVRIGRMARTLLGEPPVKADIGLYGSFAETGRGHGTDRALVAGLLGMKPDDLRIPESFSVAKEQGLSLSPVKISGTCGRLMCCLKYEQEAYTDLLKHTPKVGAIVNTPEGRGLVVENNLIAGTLKVKLNNTPEDAAPKSFTVKQCKLVKDGYIKLDKKEMEKFKGLE